MKKLFLLLLLLVTAGLGVSAQDYSLVCAGQGRDGQYFVKVTTILDKNQNKDAVNWLRRLAVDGVLFRGVASDGKYPSQKPLVTNPDVAVTKAEFFTAFNTEKAYQRYTTINNSSVTVTKLPKKKFEVTGLVLVDKETLIGYLTDHGIIENFDSLW